MACRCRASTASISWFHSVGMRLDAVGRPIRRRPWRWIRTSPSSTTERYDVAGSRKSPSRRRASSRCAWFSSSKLRRKMQEQEVAFMAQQRVHGALAALAGLLHGGQRAGSLLQSLRAFRGGSRRARRSAEPHHLVQHAGAFDGKRHGGQDGLGQCFRGHGLSIILTPPAAVRTQPRASGGPFGPAPVPEPLHQPAVHRLVHRHRH